MAALQVITTQDTETGRTLTLTLSPGANGLMVYCYIGEQTEGAPVAEFQVASYQDELELLYWDATTIPGEGPKRLVLAEARGEQRW